MSQSAIWDALLVAGDALQDGRIDDCEGVLRELDAMGAWAFELLPEPLWDLELIAPNADIANAIDRINREIMTAFAIPTELLGGPATSSTKRRLEAHFGLPHR